MKPPRTNGKRTKGETAKAKLSKDQSSNRRRKKVRSLESVKSSSLAIRHGSLDETRSLNRETKELTANELMLEAWKKLYETRRERLL